MFAGVDLTIVDAFHDHALLRAQRHSRRGIVADDALAKLHERLFETKLRNKLERSRFTIQQLNISLVGARNLDSDVENIFEAGSNVFPLFGAERTDLIESPHRFQVRGAVFQNSEQTRFTLTQFLGAIRHLLFEPVLGLAQLFFQRLLRGQVGNDDADRVCLRLKFRKRHEDRNKTPVAGSERVLASNALLVRALQVFEKPFAHLRHNEVPKMNAARLVAIQTKNAGEVTIAV